MDLKFRKKLRRVLFVSTAKALGLAPAALLKIVVDGDGVEVFEVLVPAVYASVGEAVAFLHMSMMAELSFDLTGVDLAEFNQTYDAESLVSPGSRGIALFYTKLLSFVLAQSNKVGVSRTGYTLAAYGDTRTTGRAADQDAKNPMEEIWILT